MNMAVAIHLNLTNKLDYAFKDFPANKWKLYEAYFVLCKLPKFKYNASSVPPDTIVENDDTVVGMTVIGREDSTSNRPGGLWQCHFQTTEPNPGEIS